MINQTDNIQTNSDHAVIKRIINGSIEQFEILIRRHNSFLYKIARSYGFNHQDAEDLMQDTNIAAYAALDKFEGHSSYKTWIYRIMVNKCLYRLKYGYLKNEVLKAKVLEPNTQSIYIKTNESTADGLVNNHELNRIVERSLLNIPLKYRTVFALREIEGFSVAETAQLLNITSMNVKVRLSRAKTMLQSQVGKFYSATDIYAFNLIYCDAIVDKILARINAFSAKHAE
jgi:RNA polymerase sigma-70 factor (ECF subfamily)